MDVVVAGSEDLSIDLERETAALRRLARGILFEPGLAEDAVQEAWLAALRARRLGPADGGWWNQAVHRISRGMRRSQARRVARERVAARAEGQPGDQDGVDRLELLRSLLAAVAELDEPYRSAVRMRLVDGLPPREIAARCGVQVETVRTRIKRGVERLRARLDEQHASRRDGFLAALAPLAGSPGLGLGVSGGAITWTSVEGMIMGATGKIAGAALVAALACVWIWRPWQADEASSGAAVALGTSATVSGPEAPPAGEASSSEAVQVAAPRAGDSARVVEASAPPTEGPWRIVGRVQNLQGEPIGGVEVEVEIVAGYAERDPQSAVIATQRVTSGTDGGFAWGIEPPDGAVRVCVDARLQDHYTFPVEHLVVRGAPPPSLMLLTLTRLDVVLRGRVVDDGSRPVIGARVQAARQAVETDADGGFTLRSASAFGEDMITASATGFGEQRRQVALPAAGSVDQLEFRLVPETPLRGRVVDPDGFAVAGARVSTFGLTSATAISSGDGRFVLHGIGVDTTWLSVGVEAPGFARLRRSFDRGVVPPDEVEFRLDRGVGVVGQVVDDSGKGLPGARLFVGRSRFDVDTKHAIAGDEGRFEILDLPRGSTRVHVEALGWAPCDQALVIPEHGSPDALVLALARGTSITGFVVDPSGRPVVGASVMLRRDGEYLEAGRATSAEDGAFTLRGVPQVEGLEFELFRAGYTRMNQALGLEDLRIAREQRLILHPAARLHGIVLDAATEKPISAFRVAFTTPACEGEAEMLGGYSVSWQEPGREFRDESGRWDSGDSEFEADRAIGLYISAAGHGPVRVDCARTSIDPDAAPIVVRLGPAGAVVGRVVDARNGNPIAGARVRRVPARQLERSPHLVSEAAPGEVVSTDAHGAFEFRELALEPLVLQVDADGFAPLSDGPFDVAPTTVSRTLALTQGASVSGLVLDASGNALADVPVVFFTGGDSKTPYRSWSLRADAAGRFYVRDLAPGRYHGALQLSHEFGSVSDLATVVEVAAIGEHELVIQPRGRSRIHGDVRDAAGPLALGALSAWREADPSQPDDQGEWRAALVRDGRYEITGLAPGRWKLMLRELRRQGSGRHASGEVVLGSDDDRRVDLEVLAEPRPPARN